MQVCIMLKDVLRKYPDRYEGVIVSLEKCLRDVDEPEGKAAVVWMIGSQSVSSFSSVSSSSPSSSSIFFLISIPPLFSRLLEYT
jgi:hypothetical protein